MTTTAAFPDPTADALLGLFEELQVLDRVPRTGFALRGVADAESVSEHSWHLALLVWALAPRAEGVDPARALSMALLHDVAEVATGDLPMTASHHFPPGAKRAAEASVAAELLAPLPSDALELYAEYQAGESPEARFVKACDKLQLMIKVTVYERWRTGDLSDFWENERNFDDGGWPIVAELFDRLRATHAAR